MAWLLLALPSILLVVLIVPLRVRLTFAAGLEWRAKLTFHWLFFTLRPRGRKQAKRPKKDNKKQKQATKKRSQRAKLMPAQMVRLGQKHLPRLWRALHLRCTFLDIDVLLADPALMGYVFAICSMNDWPPEPVRLSVGMAEETIFDLEGCIESKLYPGEWLLLLLRIAFEPPIRRLWWRKRKEEARNARTKDAGRAVGKHDFQQDGNRRTNFSG